MLRRTPARTRADRARRQRRLSLPQGGLLHSRLALEPLEARAMLAANVLINEIMYHPPSDANPALEDPKQEFIELFNQGNAAAALNGWRLSQGVDYTFGNVTLGAGQYLVIAADLPTFNTKHPGVLNVVGPWIGTLSDSGEKVQLQDNTAKTIDNVSYADEGDWATRTRGVLDHGHQGWDWTATHDGAGNSLELRNAALLNDAGQNWGSSVGVGGTPGVANSIASANIAPLITGLTQFPLIPRSTDTVTVTATILDELATGLTVTLKYRVDGAPSFTTLTMFDDGLHGDGAAGDKLYGATIPAQANNTVVEFYVQAVDAASNSRTWPAASQPTGQQLTNALYQVDNTYNPATLWTPGAQPIYRLIMTEAERAELVDIGNGGPNADEQSNAEMNGTLVTLDGTSDHIRYDVGIRNRGHGSRFGPPNNYHIAIPDDNPWKNVTSLNLNTRYTHSQTIGAAILQMAGLPAGDAVPVQVRVNGQNLAQAGGPEMFGSYVAVEEPDGEYVNNHFAGDSNGNLYSAYRTDPGTPTYPQQADLRYEGTNPVSYQDTYFKQTNSNADDWSDLIHMTDVLNNAPAATYFQDVSRVINIDEWMHYLALDSLLLNLETGLNNGLGDDYVLYRGEVDQRFVLVPHDLDTLMNQGNTTGNASTYSIFNFTGVAGLNRFLNDPQILPLYYHAFVDLIGTVFNPTTLNPLIDQALGSWVTASNVAAMKQFVVDRTAGVLAQIPQQFLINSTLPVVGGYPQTGTAALSLAGAADVSDTKSVMVDGHPATWNPKTGAWTLDGGGVAGSQTLVPTGATWDYLDTGTNQGPNWHNQGFSYWKSGPAQLGYGDGDEATTVSYGLDPNNKFVTTYFRKEFTVTDVSLISSLTLRYKRDDGIAVYLNGTEISRDNLAAGAAYNTYATAVAGDDGVTIFTVSNVNKALLVNGRNVIAVEIHQANANSSDISFDLDFVAAFTAGGSQTLIPMGAVWRYLDDGSNQGSTWRNLDFEGWKMGAAELGYGDVQTTVVGYGPDANNKYITTYFRHLFTIADLSLFSSLTVNFRRDDGIAIYLNGTEIGRDNLAAGAAYNTPATAVAADDGNTAFTISGVNKNLLVNGTNVIAVEIHQDAVNSSDISFDLELTGALTGGGTQTIIPFGATSTWSYLDNGTDQGTTWRDPNFDSWRSGPAQLGYGDGDEVTTVGFIDTDSVTAGVQKNITTYFRHAFTVPAGAAATYTAAVLSILRDDGVSVYLNGVEVVRNNLNGTLGDGTILYTTLAPVNIVAPEESAFTDYAISPALLRDGLNVLAVEIHQSVNTSADISFDAKLTVTTPVGSGTGAVILNPGINRVIVETFDNVNGSGNKLDSGSIDIWYNGAAVPASPPLVVSNLNLLVPDKYLTGVPILVQVQALDANGNIDRELWDTTATLATDRGEVTLSTSQITMHNGWGSALVTITGTSPFTLTAGLGSKSISRSIGSLAGVAMTNVSGTLSGSATTWSGIVHVTADVIVPVGHTLTINPGTLVLLDGVVSGTNGADIEIDGKIQSLGTAAQPVTITAFNPAQPWGELRHNSSQPSLYQYTLVNRAGNSPGVGHTGTGPALRSTNSTITLDHTSITDNVGKVSEADGSNLTVLYSEFARSVMGPEIAGTALLLDHTWISEMRGVNDNDGIYLHDQQVGQTITLQHGVVAGVDDDGVDTLDSVITVDDYIVRNCKDKAVSVFGGVSTIKGSLFVDDSLAPEDGSGATLSAKANGTATVTVNVDHTTIVSPTIGIQARNKTGQPLATIIYNVTNSIIQGVDPVEVDAPYDPTNIHISYSNVGEAWPGTGNINQTPLFLNPTHHNYHLQAGSPSVNAGNPASPNDPDGSQADQGYSLNGIAGTLAPATLTGTLSGTTILVPSGGPYHVTGNVTIPAGSTLYIMPGTTIEFDQDRQLTISGRLVAEGTPYEHIRFTRVPGTSAVWGGVQFSNTMQDNRLTYADLEWGGTTNDLGMVGMDFSNVTIDHSNFDHATNRRIRWQDSSLIVQNSTFTDIFGPGIAPTTDNFSEHIWGRNIPVGGHFIIQDNYFGLTKGHNDAIDVDGGFRPAEVLQILRNTFIGGGDDAMDLEGDAHIEGNLVMNFIKDQYNTSAGNSNTMSLGAGHWYVVERNTFVHSQHIAQVKDNAFLTFVNNDVIDCNLIDPDPLNPPQIPAIYFIRPGVGLGRGAYLEGNIFENSPAVLGPTLPADVVINRSIVPANVVSFGVGNLTEDPRITNKSQTALNTTLRPGSPAKGSGFNGADMGSQVPAGATIGGEPSTPTTSTSATLTIGGPDTWAYKYRVNGGAWSAVVNVTNPGIKSQVIPPIQLTGLTNGTYTVEVVRQNSAFVWQADFEATTSKTWTVNTNLSRLIINEVLANNVAAVDHFGTHPDAIELFNGGAATADLSGMSISDTSTNPTKFVFPGGTLLAPGAYLVLYADDPNATAGLHLGFSLDGNGEGVFLYNTVAQGGGLIDSISFGQQIPDLSIGRIGQDQHWGLTQPTLGGANVAVRTGDPATLKINEWFTNGDVRLVDDSVELYNPDPLPVPLAGLYLTDDPVAEPDKHQIAPLSFVAGSGFAVFTADSNQSINPSHVNFKLSADYGMLGLFNANLALLSKVIYYPQTTDYSQGRTTEGATTYAFFNIPTPGLPNTAANNAIMIALAANLRITEIMYNPVGGNDYEYVELRNIGATPITLTGVRLASAIDYTFPAMTLGAGQYVVVPENVAAFKARYGNAVNVPGAYIGNLSNSGEGVTLQLPANYDAAILRFDYKDTWYPTTDGPGYSLVIVNPLALANTWDLQASWRASLASFGSPGAVDVVALQVKNTDNSGNGSLRQAILDANATPGVVHDIVFAIPGVDTQTISPDMALPPLSDPAIMEFASGATVQIGTGAGFSLDNFPNLTKAGAGTLILGGNLAHGTAAVLNAAAGTLNLTSDVGANVTLNANSTTTLSATQHLAGLTVGTGTVTTLTAGGGRVIVTGSLSVSGALNLADNDLVVQAAPGTGATVLTDVLARLTTGYSGGLWTGLGMNSSAAAAAVPKITALGAILNRNSLGQPIYTTFSGVPIGVDSVLVKYTYYGDGNVDGRVDGTDYALIDNGFNFGLSQWFNGDFNFSGTIDGTDYALIDNAFNTQSGVLSVPAADGFVGGAPAAASPTPVAAGVSANDSQTDAAALDPLAVSAVLENWNQQAVQTITRRTSDAKRSSTGTIPVELDDDLLALLSES